MKSQSRSISVIVLLSERDEPDIPCHVLSEDAAPTQPRGKEQDRSQEYRFSGLSRDDASATGLVSLSRQLGADVEEGHNPVVLAYVGDCVSPAW